MKLSLRVTVHVEDSGYLLDFTVTIEISDVGSLDQKDLYIQLEKQMSLP